MKKLLMTVVALGSAFLVACGKDGGGSNTVVNPPVGGCPSGTVWNGTVCVNGGTTVPNGGNFEFYAATNYGNTSITITNDGVYKNFLQKALGVCATSGVIGNTSYKCENWNSSFLEVAFAGQFNVNPNDTCYKSHGQVTPQSMQVRVQALPYSNSFIQWGGAFWPAADFWPYNNNRVVTGTGHHISQCAGVDIWATYNRYTFQIRVENGTLNSNQLNFKLFWAAPPLTVGTEFAQGVMVRTR